MDHFTGLDSVLQIQKGQFDVLDSVNLMHRAILSALDPVLQVHKDQFGALDSVHRMH